MEKHLVLVGGGHAHMETLAKLHELTAAGHRVTVIGPSEHHYYSGMGPGMLGGTYTPEQIRFATRQVVEKQGAEFIIAKVERVDPEFRTLFLDSGQTETYDVLSFNAGSYVPEALVVEKSENLYPVKPIDAITPAISSRPWPRWSAAAAAVGRTWPRPAAPNRKTWMRPWRRSTSWFRAECRWRRFEGSQHRRE